MAPNCTGTRLAYVSKHNTLKFFDLPSESNAIVAVPKFERKEVWSVEWDMVRDFYKLVRTIYSENYALQEKDDTLAIMEKQRLIGTQNMLDK